MLILQAQMVELIFLLMAHQLRTMTSSRLQIRSLNLKFLQNIKQALQLSKLRILAKAVQLLEVIRLTLPPSPSKMLPGLP